MMVSNKVSRSLKKFLPRIRKKNSDITDLYAQKDFLSAYSEHTDLRVDQDPHDAVGGMWEEIGKLQFKFLVRRGLRPENTMLDIGCGTLRGGRHFIGYLDREKYTGIDISKKALEFAKSLVHEEGLSEKKPLLILNEDPSSMFGCVGSRKFDFLLAQSVFTHLPKEIMEEVFRDLHNVMGKHSILFFTFWESGSYDQIGAKDFAYPISYFEDLAMKHKFQMENCSGEYSHPRNQKMATLTLA